MRKPNPHIPYYLHILHSRIDQLNIKPTYKVRQSHIELEKCEASRVSTYPKPRVTCSSLHACTYPTAAGEGRNVFEKVVVVSAGGDPSFWGELFRLREDIWVFVAEVTGRADWGLGDSVSGVLFGGKGLAYTWRDGVFFVG